MITLTNVTKQFNGITAVEDLNFQVKRGEIVGLLGPNGAGKTTTLRMITGVLPPSKGDIKINNMDMKTQGFKIKKDIGFLPENNPLYEDLTVEEHLNFWACLKDIPQNKKVETIDYVLKNTGIGEVYFRQVGELSKGFKQRIGLAQALLSQPAILIMDEPTEGLDPNQRRDIKTLIQNLGKKRTVIISSHVLSEVAKMCTRLIIIHKGKIIADDTPANLAKSKGNLYIEAQIRGKNVLSILKKITGVKNIKDAKNDYFVIETEIGLDIREEIYNASVKNGWKMLTLFKKEPELEEVFSQLTAQ